MNARNRHHLATAALAALLFIGCKPGHNPLNAQPTLALSSKITGLANPIQLVNAGDGTGRLFVVQKGGIIKVYSSSYASLGTFLTMSGILTSGEQGLLSLVFHPDYESNGFFWVYYVNGSGDLEVARYQVSGDPNVADAASKQVVLTIPHPTNTNHNGGEMHFGTDGNLYLSTGDGGGGGDPNNNSQNTASLLGKLLRISPSTGTSAPWYTVPAGNPFSNEVYCLGLRNPFRWSFDPLNGDLWIGDVGQNAWEEIDYRAAASINGTNFGWRCYEGNATYNTSGCGPMSSYIFPVYVYPTASRSIIGGQVYRGTSYAAMYGMYVGCDYYSGNFYKIVSNGGGGWNTTVQTALQTNVADFGVDEAGEMFAVVNNGTTGTVYQIQGGTLPVELAEFSARFDGSSAVELSWRTASEANLSLFEIELSADGQPFQNIGSVKAENSADGATYRFRFEPPGAAKAMLFRLRMIDFDGKETLSEIASLDGRGQSGKATVPVSIENGLLVALIENEGFDRLEVVATDGRVLLSENISGQSGRVEIPVEELPKGACFVRLKGEFLEKVQPVVVR